VETIFSMCPSRRRFWRLPFSKSLAGVDEEYVVWLLAFLEHQYADRDAGGIKQIGGQADDRINVPIAQQLGADSLFRSATE
jgi:hypothetical protein